MGTVKLWKIALFIVVTYILYLLLCLLIPPAFQKSLPEDYQADLSDARKNKNAGEQLLLIDESDDALLWRLRAIESAQERIILATFDIRNDQSGTTLFSVLHHAAERGVNIQILIDGTAAIYGLHSSAPFRALAAMPQVEIRLYNPIDLKTPFTLNYRMHDKYLLIDDDLYILGGRNSTDYFLGDPNRTTNMDRDVLVYRPYVNENTSFAQIEDYFNRIWEQPCCKPLVFSADQKTAEAEQALRAHRAAVMNTLPAAFETVDWSTVTEEVKSISLWTNGVEPCNKEPLLWNALYSYMEQGKQILIQTPYIICNDTMYRGLAHLSDCGKRVDILTNSTISGANPFGCTDYLNQKNSILETGVGVYECIAGKSLHTKTVLIDQNISIIGSYNLDMRSTYIDTEMMLVIESNSINSQLRETAAELMRKSNYVQPDGTTQTGDLYQPVSLSPGKKILTGILRVFSPLFRHIL